jgi:hypothetical protein
MSPYELTPAQHSRLTHGPSAAHADASAMIPAAQKAYEARETTAAGIGSGAGARRTPDENHRLAWAALVANAAGAN